jgi:hypothetical protein
LAQVEVATFRSDNDYSDGRRPTSVHFESDPRQDVLRRDFTINGLMMDPETAAPCWITSGAAPIWSPHHPRHRRSRRTLPRRSSAPAARRALRRAPGVRHRSGDIRRHPARRTPSSRTVSAERVREELARILTEGGARRGFELLDESGLLAGILPEVAAMKGVEQPPEFHPEGDVWVHTLMLLKGLTSHPHPGLGALLHDVGKPPVPSAWPTASASTATWKRASA